MWHELIVPGEVGRCGGRDKGYGIASAYNWRKASQTGACLELKMDVPDLRVPERLMMFERKPGFFSSLMLLSSNIDTSVNEKCLRTNESRVKWYRYPSVEAPHGIGIKLTQYQSID